MPDRKQLIAALEGRIIGGEMHNGGYIHVPQEEAESILALLKEQDTLFVYSDDMVPICQSCGLRPFHGYIPTLKQMKDWGYKYCPGCGRAVKWDA